ncbi:MAG: efflux RND transporter periplasmic adaptor subunit [Myxococcota bacterium]|nr:efflux RND transporter periplasmic adaptor subunit [Myxococcota bacterium]
MKPRILRALVAATTLAFAAFGCTTEEEKPRIIASPVFVVAATEVDVTDRIEATGELLAKDDASVAAQVGGAITETLIEEGSSVAAGDVVVEIDPERRALELEDQMAQVVQAQAQLEEAKRNQARLRQLRERKAVSQAQFDEAETQLRLAHARLRAATARRGIAERALRDSTVRAPFTGFIARRYVNPGEFVAAGAPLFDLVALDPIEVEFYLPETETHRVRLGVPVEVQVAPFPEETFLGTIAVISPTIDPQTRTLRVRASIDNRDGRLRPGLFARADLGVAERPGVVMVPEDAVLQRADGSVIFVMEGSDRVRRVRIETGVYQDGDVEVREGIAGNELVVVRGQTDLIHGSKVSLRNRDGSPADAPTAPIGVTQEETSAEASGGAGG